MDHDVAALQDRITRLELELETSRARPEPRSSGLWAWWERHGRRVLFTITLVAVAAPTAVWLQARHEQRMLAMEHRHEAKLVRSESLLQHRHERILVYLDAAVNAGLDDPRRVAALRFLAEHVGPERKSGRWAIAELERMGSRSSSSPRPHRRGCGG